MRPIQKIVIGCCFAIVLCAGSLAEAQTGAQCKTFVAYQSFQPASPGAYACSSPNENGSVIDCTLKTNMCAPPAGAIETQCAACMAAHAGKPIDLANGDTYIIQTDLSVPGLGGGLALTRTWNSVWPATQSAFSTTGIFGVNWRSTYEERIFIGSDNYIKYSRNDGSFWSFGYVSASNGISLYGVAAPANASVTLAASSTQWTLTFKNAEQRVFDMTSGSLLSIIDRNGNTTQLAYDGANRLVSVTDPASRHLYFNYANPSNMYLVTSVTSDFGISTSYSYDSQGRLTQVTRPDATTWSFQYNAQSLITAVLDSEGKVLESHTYDSLGRGLTSSRAGGVEAVTVTYP